MSLAVIKDNHITLAGSHFFTGNAPTVSIGSYGEKATPVFGQNKLEVKGHIPALRLQGKVRTVPPIDLDISRSSKADFTGMVSASLKVIGFSGSAGAVYESLADKHLKLVQLWVEEEGMKSAANQSPRVLDNLAGYGGDARIAHQVLIVMEATLAKSFAAAAHFDVSADAAGIVSINGTGGGAVSGGTRVTLSPNTCIAYLLLKLDWNRNKSAIDSTKVDEWSVN